MNNNDQARDDITNQGVNDGTRLLADESQAKIKDSSINFNDKTEAVASFQRDGQTYISLPSLFEILGYDQVLQLEDRLQAGFNDVVYEVGINSNQAFNEEEEALTLPQSTLMVNGETFISVDSLQVLLQDLYQIDAAQGNLNISLVGEEYGFPGGEDLGELEINDGEDVPAVSAATADRIIRTARRYIGTPYRFGASTDTTRVFDCSSFTKHVYGVHGIYLYRTSRSQAKQGYYVPVSRVRKGDLLFFYWPGRYSSNKVVGHVGIYMGGGYMIHTTPSKGVHIVNVAKSSYWRGTYLGAKRGG